MYHRKPTAQSSNKVGFLQKGSQPGGEFESIAAAPSAWVGKAEEIDRMVHLGLDVLDDDIQRQRACAKSDGTLPLEDKPFVWDVTLFLAACAIENLLKGLIMRVHPEYAEAGKLSRNVTTHDLELLAESARVQRLPEEIEFCRYGTEAILSFGRYPVAKDCRRNAIRRTTIHTAFEVYEHFFARLRAQIVARPRKS
jgi:hypothetical protein